MTEALNKRPSRMATLTGFEPAFEISRCCVISAQMCDRLRVTRENANWPVCTNRAELRSSRVRICPNKRGGPNYRCCPSFVNSTGILTFETVLGLNFHVRTVLRTDLSNRGLPVLCAIEARVTPPLAGSTDTTQTPLPAMRRERASCGYAGRGA
jgi:hypothetical protein